MNKELICFFAVLWIVACLVLDIFIYKKSKRWLLRFLPAILKGIGVLFFFALRIALLGSMFTEKIPAEQDYFALMAVLMLMGLWIDLMVWFFSSNPFTKKKRIVLACVILGIILVAIVGSFLEGDGGYRMTKGPNQWKMVFSGNSLQSTRTMNLGDGDKVLSVQIESEAGTVDIIFTDDDGNILYSDESIRNDTFTVETTGKVSITVIVNEYTGSVVIDRVAKEQKNIETS